MGIGITENLALAAVSVWLFSLFISIKHLGLVAALLISLLRVGLTLVYFSYLFTNDMLMKDDQVYHELSVFLFDRGWGPIRMILEPQGFREVGAFVGSGHNFYYWWNLLAFTLFGKFYYSAVFLNVGLTFVSAALLYQLLLESQCTKTYAKYCCIFFLLHWDIITWSSFVNLKDMLVLTLTILSMLTMAKLLKSFSIAKLLIVLAVFGLFTMIRYYLPALLTMAGLTWHILEKRNWKIIALVPIAILVALTLMPSVIRDLSYFQIGLPFYPALRFFLMPQFWTLEPNEQFLFISALCHWLLFIPLLYGATLIWKLSPVGRLVLIYSAVIIAFYSLVPELQGYRHRMQISFAIAWCQFHALWMLLFKSAKPISSQKVVS